jgi:CheY-like chemotaxis protein
MPAVLIVESDEDLREVLVEGFRMEGWTSLAAASVSEAVNKATGVHVDVVLTDVILSKGDAVALELAFRRRRELRHVPFVFMTGFAPYLDQLGPGCALLKPFRLEQACVLLRATVAARVPLQN